MADHKVTLWEVILRYIDGINADSTDREVSDLAAIAQYRRDTMKPLLILVGMALAALTAMCVLGIVAIVVTHPNTQTFLRSAWPILLACLGGSTLFAGGLRGLRRFSARRQARKTANDDNPTPGESALAA